MGDVVNLNKYRKTKQRLGGAKAAVQNRVRFGRDKGEREKARVEQERTAKELDDKRLK